MMSLVVRRHTMTLNVYAANFQPATRYVDRSIGEPMHFRNNPRRQIACDNCGQARWAAKLRVQVYYDMLVFTCRQPYKRRK